MQTQLVQSEVLPSLVLGSLIAKEGGKKDWKGKPADWSDIRKDCPANSIALYAGHPADYSEYDNLGFTATCTGGYNVFIDGVQYGTTYASGAQCDITWSTSGITTGDDITTPSAMKAHKIWIIPATEGAEITAFKCMRVAASGNEEQGVLWAHLNLTNTINLTRDFAYDGGNNNPLMEALTAKNNLVKVNGLSVCFYNNTSLSYVPTIDGQNNTMEIYGLFYRTAIKKVDIKNLKFAEGSIAFYSCYNLEELPKGIDYSDATNMSYFLFYNYALKDTVLDVSAATGLTRIGLNGATGIKGLRVSNQAPFNSSEPQIDIRETGLDRTALVQLFNDLPTVSDGQIVNITGTAGESSLTTDDVLIAVNKGWTVSGGPELTTYYRYTYNSNNIYITDNPINDGTWTQPALTENGTVGGDVCAVESNVAQSEGYAVWKGFDNDDTSEFSAFWSTPNGHLGYFTYYTPTPICVNKITFINNSPSCASGAGIIYGSNDNNNWTEITTYTHSGSDRSWDIDLSSNTNYYKYYKVQNTQASDWAFWAFNECKFTGKSQNVSTIYDSTFVPMSPQPEFSVSFGLKNAVEVGSLNNNNGIYSGFSQYSRIALSETLPSNFNNMTFIVKFKTQADIGVMNYDIIANAAATKYIFLRGESRTICMQTGSGLLYGITGINNNSDYELKIVYSNGVDTIYVNGIYQYDTTYDMFKNENIRLGGSEGTRYDAFEGSMDMPNSSYEIDGVKKELYTNEKSIVINNNEYSPNGSVKR